MLPEEIDLEKFATALAARLDVATPPEWRVWSQADHVHYGPQSAVTGSGSPIVGHGVAVVVDLSPFVMSDMQDELIEYLGEEWPPNRNWRESGDPDPVPREWVRLQHTGVLELGYGDQTNPALVLEPIDLRDCEPQAFFV